MNFLGQTTIIKSIGVLSKNLYKKKVETIGFILLELLLGSISLFVFSACAVAEMKTESGNIPYFCSIVEIIEAISILILTKMILLNESENKIDRKLNLKYISIWIITFIGIVIISKSVDILVINNLKSSFYNIMGRMSEFSLVRAVIMYLCLSMIVAIPMYLISYTRFNIVKGNNEISLITALKSFFRNILVILIFWILDKSIEVLSLILISKYYLICGAICSITYALYLALVVSSAYVSVENDLQKYDKNAC